MAAVMAATSAMVASEVVRGVGGESEREGSRTRRRRLMFRSSREASAAAIFWARTDSDMSQLEPYRP